MVVGLVMLAAAAEPCPDPGPALDAAERDIVDFFLADALRGLEVVREAWGCGPPATSEHLARYWAASGMVLHLQGNPGVEASFQAGRRAGGSTWNPAYGDAARALWDAADPPSGPGRALQLRGGLLESEQAWVDGTRAPELAAGLGLHLLQVGPPTGMRFAKLVEVTPGEGPLLVVPPETAASVPVLVPAPMPAPVAPIEPPQPPPLRRGLAPVGQVAGLALAGGAAYTSYLFLWDLTTGHGQPPGLTATVGVGSALVSAGAVGLVTRSILRGPARRGDRASSVPEATP
jgi:hypothetical protein